MISMERRPPAGPVRGTRARKSGVAAFLGIPYALPPVGSRRWKPSEPMPSWGSVRYANRVGPAAMQASLPAGTILSHPDWPTSEDCLFLNIWTAAEAGDGRPVMVWIHGGGYMSGTAAYPEYDGSALAAKGAVLVSLNYRLGPFGFFCHPGLASESPDGASGNYGLGDILLALRWVKENIRAFGGDPERVTLFGESAGAWAVNQLQASPLSAGLFHRAIGQSGSSMARMRSAFAQVDDAEPAEQTHARWAEVAGCSSISMLRDLPAGELLHRWDASQMPSEAVIDGWIIPRQVQEIFARGEQQRVPLLAGFNEAETELLASFGLYAPESGPEAYTASIRERFGSLAGDFLDHFPANDVRGSTMAAYRDGLHGGLYSMESWARANHASGSPAYLYLFTHKPAENFLGLGACHMAEIPYVLGHVATNADFAFPVLAAGPVSPADITVAERVSDLWLEFAAGGSPGSAWPPFDPDSRQYLAIGSELAVLRAPFPGRFELFERIAGQFVGQGRFRSQIYVPAGEGFSL